MESDKKSMKTPLGKWQTHEVHFSYELLSQGEGLQTICWKSQYSFILNDATRVPEKGAKKGSFPLTWRSSLLLEILSQRYRLSSLSDEDRWSQ